MTVHYCDGCKKKIEPRTTFATNCSTVSYASGDRLYRQDYCLDCFAKNPRENFRLEKSEEGDSGTLPESLSLEK